jgi:DNA primase
MDKRQAHFSGDSATQAVKARLNIADIVRRYVALQRVGSRWMAPCPFHQETKPSFSVNEEEGFFYCFGCNASGDVFDFYSRINGLDFRETLEQLALEAGVRLEEYGTIRRGGRESGDGSLRRTALKMHETAEAYFIRALQGTGGEECRDYLKKRRVAPEIVEDFGLGWSERTWRGLADSLLRAGFTREDAVKAGLLSTKGGTTYYDLFRGRLMFPVRDLSGRVIAFGGRVINEESSAKYINSPDSPLYKKGDQLYGFFQARKSITSLGSVLLTEGYMDVLTLHQFGYHNACGVLGTALTPEQVKRLAGFRADFELLFDGDRAGRKAALHAAEMVLAKGLRCRVVLLPEGEDIDSFLQFQGRERFEELRRTALDGMEFCIRTLAVRSPREGVEWVKGFLAKVEVPELVSGYVSALALGLQLDEAVLRRRDPDGEERGVRGRKTTVSVPAPHALDPQRQLVRFLVWYPHCLPRFKECGLELLLTDAWARTWWNKIASAAPDFDPAAVEERLDEEEKAFWIRQRLIRPPLENEEQDVAAVCRTIEEKCFEQQKKSCVQALRQTSSGGEFDRDFLKAVQETVRRSYGER